MFCVGLCPVLSFEHIKKYVIQHGKGALCLYASKGEIKHFSAHYTRKLMYNEPGLDSCCVKQAWASLVTILPRFPWLHFASLR